MNIISIQGEGKVHVQHIRTDLGQQDIDADNIRVAAALNAQLEFEDGTRVVFVLPRGMDPNNSMASKGVVLFGASGCGKTRCLFGILKSRLHRGKIFIINPKGLAEDEESRRSHLSGILDEEERRDN